MVLIYLHSGNSRHSRRLTGVRNERDGFVVRRNDLSGVGDAARGRDRSLLVFVVNDPRGFENREQHIALAEPFAHTGEIRSDERSFPRHSVALDTLRRDEQLLALFAVTFARAIEIGNKPGYGLSGAVYTTDPATAFRFRQGTSAGMVSVNNSTSGAEAHLPFGGNGRSGNGSRQSGMWVLDQFTRWQSMNWDYSGKLQKAQMDVMDLPSDPEFRLPAP